MIWTSTKFLSSGLYFRVRAWISRPVYNSDVRTKDLLQNQMHYFFMKYSDKLQADLVYFNFGVLSYCI